MNKNEKIDTAFFKYINKGNIGNGGSANVYKVIREFDQKEFALKLLKNDGSEKIKRFKNEFAFSITHHHENLISIVDFGKDKNGRLFYIMPLAECTLRDSIRDKNLAIDTKIKYIKEIINGLNFLHTSGVIHRDLKPENLLMVDGTVKIADLGIAHFNEDQLITAIETKNTAKLANFQYAAPEQRITGNANAITAAVDIYSLGVIIHELLTGEFIQGKSHCRIKDLYPQYYYLDDIIGNSLHNDPEKRIQNASDLASEIAKSKCDIRVPIRDFRSTATHFYCDRFCAAFPDIDKQQEFSDKKTILKRLDKLLRPPYFLPSITGDGGFSSIYWTRGTLNNSVELFHINWEESLAYIEKMECKIKRIVAFDNPSDYRVFVYLELDPMPSFWNASQADIEEMVRNATDMKVSEYINIYDGKSLSVSEADSGCFYDNEGNRHTIDSEKLDSFQRFIAPWNFLLLSQASSIVQSSEADLEIQSCMNDILKGTKTPYNLLDITNKLKRPNFYS